MPSQALSESEIRDAVTSAFERPDRVQTILVHDWLLTIVVACDHRFGHVLLPELNALAEKFEVPEENVKLWDIAPNIIEITIDIDAPTPIDRPKQRVA